MNKTDHANNVKFAANMLTIAERQSAHATENMHIQDALYARLTMRRNSALRTGRLTAAAADKYQRVHIDPQYATVEQTEAAELHARRMVIRARRRLDKAIAASAGLTLQVAP